MIPYKYTYGLLKKLARNTNSLKNKIGMNMLKSSLRDVKFCPFIQPIFSANGESLVGCEVLLRIKRHDGYFTPAAWISELEKSDMMDSITCNLFEQVEGHFSQIKDALPEGFYFSFNLCASQLQSVRVLHAARTFNRAYAGYATLVIEIVERGVLHLDDTTIDTMDALNAEGIRFAIDDFGAGTSSLKYIEHTGFSTIKIDRELTVALRGELVYQKVIDAIVMLSRSLGLSVTAEGVENKEQMALLNKAGVSTLQGYYLARPMGMDMFVESYVLNGQ